MVVVCINLHTSVLVWFRVSSKAENLEKLKTSKDIRNSSNWWPSLVELKKINSDSQKTGFHKPMYRKLEYLYTLIKAVMPVWHQIKSNYNIFKNQIFSSIVYILVIQTWKTVLYDG